MARKKFQELNLKDAFLFAAALSDEDTCRLILEIILGCPIGPVEVHEEKPFVYQSNFRSARLDIYASDELRVNYDLEMQNKNGQSDEKMSLPKRSRFYQAGMDVKSLKPGEEISDLKPGFVIFICTFDPFSKGLYRYTFEERCLETDFPLGDGMRKIFLFTKGQNAEDVPQELIHFLAYVENSTMQCAEQTGNEKIKAIHRKVEELKKNKEVEGRYMTLGEYLDDEIAAGKEEIREEARAEGRAEGREQGLTEGRAEGRAEGRIEGRAEGRAEGEVRMSKLIACMIKDGETEHLINLNSDSEYLKNMYKKYNL